MKKLFKKSIACLIAVLMVVSTMPFTAVTVSAATQLEDFQAATANYYGTFESDSDYNTEEYYVQIYKNVLYSPSNISATKTLSGLSAEGKDKVYLHSDMYYGNTVLLYDGNTIPSMGIGFAVRGQSKPWNYGWGNVRVYRCNITGDSQGISFRDTKWHGSDGRMNYTYIMFGQNEVIGTTDEVERKQGQNGYYGNVLQYTGGDFTDSYKAIQLSFDFVVGTDEGSKQTHSFSTITESTIYVLNYKKLIDKVNEARTYYSNLDKTVYTQASLDNLVTAINNLQKFNPSSYTYTTNTGESVKKAADDMDALITAYQTAKNNLKFKTITVQFVNFAGDTVKRVTLNPGEAIGEFPANTATTRDEYGFGDTHHNKFTWNTTLTAESVPTSDITISENAKLEAHKSETPATCTTKQTCDACGAVFGNFGSHTLKETTAKDATCTEDGNSAYWTCSTCNKMFSDADATTEIKEVPTISATGHSLAKVEEVKSTCAVKGTAAYWTCSACHKMFSDEQGTNEISAPVELPLADHSWGKWTSISDTQHQRVCANEKSHVETKDHNIVNGVCTDCGYKAFDMAAYNDAVTEYESFKTGDYTAKYTAESREAYETAVEAAKRDSFDTQDEVNAAVAAILSAKTKLVYAQPEIKFVEVDANGNETVIETKNYTYGTPVEFTKDADNIAKWIVKTQNGKVETKVATSETTYTMIATEPATVYVHLTEKKTETVQYSKVSFISKNGAVSSVQYVEVGKTLNTIDVPGVKIPFYEFKNWNKASVTADGSDIEVKAVYEFIGDETNKCNVHYNGTTKTYTYDSFVYLFGAEGKKLALSTTNDESGIITYLNENAFYAPHTADIYVIVVDSQPASIGITGSYTSSTEDKKIVAFNCKFFLPEGCKVVEYGLTATSSTGKSMKIKGETASARGEYCVKVSMPNTSPVTSVDGVAYLTYKDAHNNLHTIYSTTVTQNL